MVDLFCPHCSTPAAFTPIFVNTSDKNLAVYDFADGIELASKYPGIFKAEMPVIYKSAAYAIVGCQNCSRIFIAEAKGSRWVSVYPIQHKIAPDEIPEPIKSEFEEASLCFATKANKACVLVCQVALEHVWQEQGVSGLKGLLDKGIMPPALYRRADQIRLWGNLQKHEFLTETVSAEDAEQLLGYLEILLNEVYVEPKRLDALTQKHKDLKKEE